MDDEPAEEAHRRQAHHVRVRQPREHGRRRPHREPERHPEHPPAAPIVGSAKKHVPVEDTLEDEHERGERHRGTCDGAAARSARISPTGCV